MEGRNMRDIRELVSSNDELSLRHQCDLLGVNRSSIYYRPHCESDENLRTMRLMDEYHLLHPTYGVLQMQDYLCLKRSVVNHQLRPGKPIHMRTLDRLCARCRNQNQHGWEGQSH